MTTKNQALISTIIPAFNEEENLRAAAQKIAEALAGLRERFSFELIFINDGSRDATLGLLRQFHEEYGWVHYLSFSRNFGHMSALRCGYDHARGDAVICMDADLQHPPAYIPIFLEKWQEGFEIVFTSRREAVGELGWFKRLSSKYFYRLMNWLSDVHLEPGAADFRLLDRQVVDLIRASRESDLFLRGFIPWVGFRQFRIDYTPDPRFAGQSKYTFKKILRLALTGITAFSVRPLRLAVILGACISGLAFLYALYAVYAHFILKETVQGWTSVLLSVLIIGGLQLLTLGIIGEYLGRLFMQAKGRPPYIVQESSLPPSL